MCNKGNFLEGKIVIESDLGDGELSYLYERCMFTVFPSFVEGWVFRSVKALRSESLA